MSPHDPGKKVSQLNQDDLTWTLNQPCLVTCAHCGWSHVGRAGDGQAAFLAHRLEAHPEIRPPKHRRRGFSMRTGAKGRRKALEARGGT